jgi:hypothetical protein
MEEKDLVRTALGPLYMIPALVHVPTDLYSQLKTRNKFQAQDWISAITSHNEKVGYNWVIQTK